jgi:hypothetical protein
MAFVFEPTFQVKDIGSITIEDAIELLQYPKNLVRFSINFRSLYALLG